MLSAIIKRQSIRKYKNTPVSKTLIDEILRAGSLAPSSKNRQPWRFVVFEKTAKTDMLSVMKKGLDREKEKPLLPESGRYLESAYNTLKIMEAAPTVILVLNALGADIQKPLSPEERFCEMYNMQSIGAAIQNMTLAATELGLGSLWIGDICFAYGELKNWIGKDGEPVAAMTVGYADEAPAAKPRKGLDELVEWRS